jgi:RimJ/RimL family protein N-acetyltransferase
VTSSRRLTIRPFAEPDPVATAALLMGTRPEYMRYFGPFRFDAEVIGKLAFSAKLDQWFSIEIEEEGGPQLAGFYMLRGLDEGYADPMYGVFIGEKFSGLGLARVSIVHAEAQCRLNNWKTLLLKVDPTNTRAFDLYTRAGFTYLRTDPAHGDHVLSKTILS